MVIQLLSGIMSFIMMVSFSDYLIPEQDMTMLLEVATKRMDL